MQRSRGALAASLARAEGELVAIIDDRHLPDPGWLDGLGRVFADPLVVAALGYAAPRADGAAPSRAVHSAATIESEPAALRPARTAAALARGESIVVRRAFAQRVAPLLGAAWERQLLYAALVGGMRVVEDPALLVWRQARRGRAVRAGVGAWALRRRRRFRAAALPEEGTAPPRLAAQGTPPAVSVVVPSFNRRDKLRALLEGLALQSAPPERFEVVVALDGSTDGSAAMVAGLELPFACRALELPNRGVAAARNAGVAAARHDLILNLDDDMLPAPALVEAHAAAHAEGHDRLVTVGYAAPVLDPTARSAWAHYQRAAWEDHYRRKAEADHPWTYFDFSVGNSALRRGLLEAIGGFDEEMRRHDDQESGMRLVRAGAEFRYESEALAWHRIQADLGAGLAEIRAQASHDVKLGERYPQLRGRLAVAAMSRPHGEVLSPRSSLFFRRPWLARILLALGPPATRSAAALSMRRLERRLCRDLSAVAYVRGLRDSFASLRELEYYVIPAWTAPPVARLSVDLARRAPLEIPPEGGRVELLMDVDGRRLGVVDAWDGAREWNWSELTGRAVEAMAGPSLQAVELERLLELSRGASARGR